jgi:uncharacterized protein (DUF111 family)
MDKSNELLLLEVPHLWNVDRNLVLLETNIDDMTAEHLGFATEQLLAMGAADCWLTCIVMKKQRAAHTLHCLCQDSRVIEMLQAIFRLTSTLGVRVQSSHHHGGGWCRVSLRREMIQVPIWNTQVDCKIGYLGSEIVSIKAEYEHCKRLATINNDHNKHLSIQQISEKVIQKESTRTCEQ